MCVCVFCRAPRPSRFTQDGTVTSPVHNPHDRSPHHAQDTTHTDTQADEPCSPTRTTPVPQAAGEQPGLAHEQPSAPTPLSTGRELRRATDSAVDAVSAAIANIMRSSGSAASSGGSGRGLSAAGLSNTVRSAAGGVVSAHMEPQTGLQYDDRPDLLYRASEESTGHGDGSARGSSAVSAHASEAARRRRTTRSEESSTDSVCDSSYARCEAAGASSTSATFAPGQASAPSPGVSQRAPPAACDAPEAASPEVSPRSEASDNGARSKRDRRTLSPTRASAASLVVAGAPVDSPRAPPSDVELQPSPTRRPPGLSRFPPAETDDDNNYASASHATDKQGHGASDTDAQAAWGGANGQEGCMDESDDMHGAAATPGTRHGAHAARGARATDAAMHGSMDRVPTTPPLPGPRMLHAAACRSSSSTIVDDITASQGTLQHTQQQQQPQEDARAAALATPFAAAATQEGVAAVVGKSGVSAAPAGTASRRLAARPSIGSQEVPPPADGAAWSRHGSMSGLLGAAVAASTAGSSQMEWSDDFNSPRRQSFAHAAWPLPLDGRGMSMQLGGSVNSVPTTARASGGNGQELPTQRSPTAKAAATPPAVTPDSAPRPSPTLATPGSNLSSHPVVLDMDSWDSSSEGCDDDDLNIDGDLCVAATLAVPSGGAAGNLRAQLRQAGAAAGAAPPPAAEWSAAGPTDAAHRASLETIPESVGTPATSISAPRGIALITPLREINAACGAPVGPLERGLAKRKAHHGEGVLGQEEDGVQAAGQSTHPPTPTHMYFTRNTAHDLGSFAVHRHRPYTSSDIRYC